MDSEPITVYTLFLFRHKSLSKGKPSESISGAPHVVKIVFSFVSEWTTRPKARTTENDMMNFNKRQHTKTFTGCWTCRSRRVKCDE